ncbi:hypothetical protein SLS55_004691 [Diplodia seriata]|uniref:Uncharacterized protein n=1 Tax=Diplodia seriata TaxID=420778 RepID=A0ABR3CK50_9PEZI
MPRKLPWLSDKPDPGLAEARVKKRRLQSPDLPDELDALGASTPRRKGKARATREKNASAAQNIVQHVASRGKMSVESQMKHEARALAERQVEALRGIEGDNKGADELEEEAPWVRDPHLGGLMSGSQDSSSQLATLAGIKSKTRAAAGYAGTRSKPPPSRHSDPKPSKGIRPRPSLEGLAKEIRRAEANSDEDDLDAFSTRRRPVSKEFE